MFLKTPKFKNTHTHAHRTTLHGVIITFKITIVQSNISIEIIFFMSYMCMCTAENWEIHNGKTAHKTHWRHGMLMNLWVHNPHSFCHKNTVFIMISNE